MARSYESARPVDGTIGIGWTLNLSAHLYYATYLYAAPDIYRHEADVTLPGGNRYRFIQNTDGSFIKPAGRYDSLVKNVDGSFDLVMADGSTHYHFGPSGRLETIADEFANTLSFSYDTNDRLQRVSDLSGSGRYLDVFYNAAGRISTIRDHTGRQIGFAYSADGTLASVSDPIARTVSYSYVAGRYSPLLSGISDNWNRAITSITYDMLGRTHTYSESGETFTYTYNYNGRTDQSSKVDSSGNRWIYTYGPSGVITERSYPGSALTRVTYNSDSTIAESTDEMGVKTAYTYLSLARVQTVTKDVDGATEVRFDYEYDPTFVNRVTSVMPMKRNSTTGLWGHDPNWQGWKYDYWSTGDPAPGALRHVYRVRSDGVTMDTVATYTYDTKGQVTSVSDAAGSVTDYIRDGFASLVIKVPTNNDAGTRPQTTYYYDTLGRVSSVITPDHSGTAPHDVEYGYDAVDRSTEVRDHYDGTAHATTAFAYDRYDGVTGFVFVDRTDSNSIVTHQGYDVHGRLVRSIDALGAITSYGYVRANLSTITDANGYATSYAYDQLSRLATTTFPDSSAESYTYRDDGLLATKTDRKSQTTSYGYDRLKRLTIKTYTGGSGIVYSYLGQMLTQVTDGTTTPSETHTFTYDLAFRVSTNTQATRGALLYTYTATDAVLTSAVTGGATTTYAYYPDGSLNTIQWSPVIGQFKYTYRPGGQYSTITFPNGQARSYAYDSWGRLTTLANSLSSGGTLASYTYGYDVEGMYGASNRRDQRTSLSINGNGKLSVGAIYYHYDDSYQLRGASYPHHADGIPSGAIVRDEHSWNYDAIGNRTSQEVAPGCAEGDLCMSDVAEYTYQKIGSNGNNWQRLLSDSVATYSYDANGNTTTRGTSTYSWDAENRMRTITIGTTAAATYAYDYQGRRTSKATSGTTKYLYDGLNLVGEGASLPVLTNEYLFGPGIDEPLAMKASGGAIYYYDVDALGSVTVVNNASGTAFSNYDYDAWGVTLSETETVAQPFRYTGREAGEDGHLFYRARYYRGAVGRFLSEDPLRWMAGVNHYGYALANPIQLVDPMGLDAAHVCCDGKGGFTLCWSNQPSAPFAGCIEEHEKDHIDYLSRNPGNCKGQCRDSSGKPRPAGEHTWQMTPAEHDEMECRGYAAEASCLRKAMGQASDKSAVLRRINQLIHLAKGFGNFKCNTSAW